MKLFFFDTETTGTDYQKHGIHQLSFIMSIDGKIVETMNLEIRPWNDCEYADEALQVTGKTKESIQNNPLSEEEAIQILIGKLNSYCFKFDKKDKFYMVGFNVHFDNQMLRALFLRCNEKYFGSYFWSNPIDVMTMATQKLLEHRPFMNNFQLMTVAETLGLLEGKELNFHDALFDITITKEIYDLLNRNEYSISITKIEDVKDNKPSVEKALDLLETLEDIKPPVKINTEGSQPKPMRKINYENYESLIGFGKYRSMSFKTCCEVDPQYLLWISDNLIQGIKISNDFLEEIRSKSEIQQKQKSRRFSDSDGGINYSAGSQASIDSFGGSDMFDDFPF